MFNRNTRWNNRTELFSFWGAGRDAVERQHQNRPVYSSFPSRDWLRSEICSSDSPLLSPCSQSSSLHVSTPDLNWSVSWLDVIEVIFKSTGTMRLYFSRLLKTSSVFHVEGGVAVGWRTLMVPSMKQRQFEQIERGLRTWLMLTTVKCTISFCVQSDVDFLILVLPFEATIRYYTQTRLPLLQCFQSVIERSALTNGNSMVPTYNVLVIGTVP